MNKKEIPMVPARKSSLAVIYGDTPGFLGCTVIKSNPIKNGFDVLFAGVPWEGTLTWGSFSGCELAPRYIRHAAARYGGFLPEHEIDLFDYLRIGDLGDITMNPNDPKESMERVYQTANKIYKSHSIPIMMGGDHSFSPEVVKALSENVKDRIGVIHFDAHFDNSKCFGKDEFPRCGPLHRIAQIEQVRKESIVQVGIRGPRNSPAQMEYAKSMGATIFTMKEIRHRGIEAVIEDALRIAQMNTKYIYVTICSDIIDAAFNPGGPPDFYGLFPHELFYALHRLGESGIAGLDYVEVYPIQDSHSFSSHLAAWALINVLVGLASRKKSNLSFAI